jgi:regulator of protease activity HflC (stomatin/prohibitin superfamily)
MKESVEMNGMNGKYIEEKEPKTVGGIAMLCLISLVMLAATVLMINGIIILSDDSKNLAGIMKFLAGLFYVCIGWVPYMGLKIIKPNEAMVMTLFGRYFGTLKRDGFYFVNPFVTSFNPTAASGGSRAPGESPQALSSGKILPGGLQIDPFSTTNKKISLKVSTLNNDIQKINDQLGNPVIIGIVVIWKIVNPTKAVFNVDNYKEFLSIQTDSALRNIVRLYPYDTFGDDNEKTLRGSSQEIAVNLKDEIQSKVEIGGIEVLEARITQLSYAPEIAAAMLQRQQASAIIDARQMIVEGAVGMVEMALSRLSSNDIVSLDEERKASMVSNLMVVLCGNRDAQPIINSGSLY